MAVGNFTPEEVRWEHQGKAGRIQPGEIVTNRSRGWENHVLNRWGRRGLVQLDFGADETEARATSLELYRSFWERQVGEFNELNAQLKNEGKMYIRPSAELKAHAEELGVELIGPWTLKRTTDETSIHSIPQAPDAAAPRVDALEQRVEGMETQLSSIHDMLKDMVGNMAQAEESTGKKGRAKA